MKNLINITDGSLVASNYEPETWDIGDVKDIKDAYEKMVKKDVGFQDFLKRNYTKKILKHMVGHEKEY